MSTRIKGLLAAAALSALSAVRDRTFTIEFLDPGVQAFSFTFG